MLRRLERLEALHPAKSSDDEGEWDLSALTDEELDYLGRYVESGATEADARIVEIAKKAKKV
jgi:hypothetical protein